MHFVQSLSTVTTHNFFHRIIVSPFWNNQNYSLRIFTYFQMYSWSPLNIITTSCRSWPPSVKNAVEVRIEGAANLIFIWFIISIFTYLKIETGIVSVVFFDGSNVSQACHSGKIYKNQRSSKDDLPVFFMIFDFWNVFELHLMPI